MERHFKLVDAFPSRLGNVYQLSAGTISLSTLVYITQHFDQPLFCFDLTSS